MGELGSVYGEISSQSYLVAKTAIHISAVCLLFLYLCYLGFKWFKESPQDKLLIIGFYFFITGFLLVGIVNNTYTYEDVYSDKYRDSPFYEEYTEMNLYSDLKTNKINVAKFDDTYYYINGDNWSVLDTNYFENKMMELKQS